MPDLPKANYNVWVRGYGLVDSPKVQAAPGKMLDLTAVAAPSTTAAAQYYPAIYWYSMLKVPGESAFSGQQRDKSMPANLTAQAQWVNIIKSTGCLSCHALGTIGTRTIPKELGEFRTSAEAWERRIQSGQALTQMTTVIGRLDVPLAFKLFGDWTDRIAAGELPFAEPTRPQGIERNVVLTLWDWSRPPPISTTRSRPTGTLGQRQRQALRDHRGEHGFHPDPGPGAQHRHEVKHPVRDPNRRPRRTLRCPSRTGARSVWDARRATTTR
jgi:hypothetical protein